MPKYISNKDLSPIEIVLAKQPDGWRIGELEKALSNQGLSINRRTILNLHPQLLRDLVPEEDRERFLAIAKEEIAALHEGNFARYRLRPGEFKAWETRTS